MTGAILKNAEIEWQDGLPYSKMFNDIYFSRENGAEETLYTFIEGNQLHHRWNSPQICDSFSLVELGFGTGLNFITTADYWDKSESNGWLNYYSVEKFPLTLKDLKKALGLWPQYSSFSNRLIEYYPLPVKGIWTIVFPEAKIKLHLLWMDVLEALSHFAKENVLVNAWFLDGFAPSKNPNIWQNDGFKLIAECSKAGTTLATFTAAGFVRRGLMQTGFNISKRAGFGTKREMLVGEFSAKENSFHTRRYNPNLHWKSEPKAKGNQKIGVIGAGIAGATTARYLAESGHEVTLFEKNQDAGLGASGNSAGIYYPFVSTDMNLSSQFFFKAYHQLLHDLDYFCLNDFVNQIGVLKLLSSQVEFEKLMKGFSECSEIHRWVSMMNQQDCENLFRPLKNRLGMYFPKSGFINPGEVCRKLSSHNLIRTHYSTTIMNIVLSENDKWLCIDHNNNEYLFDALVVANSYEAKRLLPEHFLPAIEVRGQTTELPLSDLECELPSTVVCDDVYLIPKSKKTLFIGATFDRRETNPELTEQSQNWLLEKTARLVSFKAQNEHALSGKVGFRYCSVDRLPIIGPLHKLPNLFQNYSDLERGKLLKSCKPAEYWPNLYLNLAHGARGITSSFISANIICCLIKAQPLPITEDIWEKLHPSRFIIRELKKKFDQRLPAVQALSQKYSGLFSN